MPCSRRHEAFNMGVGFYNSSSDKYLALRSERKVGRAVEGTGLENRQGRKSLVSSNLTPSARPQKKKAADLCPPPQTPLPSPRAALAASFDQPAGPAIESLGLVLGFLRLPALAARGLAQALV